MDNKSLAVLIGGVLPAILFGITGFLPKYIGKETATGPYLIAVGAAAMLIGVVFTIAERNPAYTRNGLLLSAVIGALWAIGVGSTLMALTHFGGNVSQLVPLYNMNTLVAVVLGLVVLSEWRTVNATQVVVASLLIVVGGAMAALSTRP